MPARVVQVADDEQRYLATVSVDHHSGVRAQNQTELFNGPDWLVKVTEDWTLSPADIYAAALRVQVLGRQQPQPMR